MMARRHPLSFCLGGLAVICGLAGGCRSFGVNKSPSIEFTEIPESAPGGAARIEPIAGRAIGARTGQQIVLFARSGKWWVQPFYEKPFTAVQKDSSWRSTTHMGTEYAALLVEPGYLPPKATDVLPQIGGKILAVALAPGKITEASPPSVPKRIHFSGYEWDVRQIASDSGGVMHKNSASNAWTDRNGWLHLRIAQESGDWTCAEINMLRSLGYGSYSFVMREMPVLEPGTVLGMFTWDDLESGQNHREMDIELSQWGDPTIKNGQFTIQPFYVPANVFRFNYRPAALTHTFQWEPGRVSFRTSERSPGRPDRLVAEHVFTSGIPSPGGETVHINLYIYGKTRTPQQSGVEVVMEKFEYLP
jgi:hypothetical protein